MNTSAEALTTLSTFVISWSVIIAVYITIFFIIFCCEPPEDSSEESSPRPPSHYTGPPSYRRPSSSRYLDGPPPYSIHDQLHQPGRIVPVTVQPHSIHLQPPRSD